MVNSKTKSNFQGKGLFHFTGNSPIWSKVRTGIQSRVLEAIMKEFCLWTVPHGLLSLVFQTTHDHLPRDQLHWTGLLYHQSLIKKMPKRLAFRPIWCRQFLNGCTFFLYNSSLYTVLKSAGSRCRLSASAKDHLAVIIWKKNKHIRQIARILFHMYRQQNGKMWGGSSLKHSAQELEHVKISFWHQNIIYKGFKSLLMTK